MFGLLGVCCSDSDQQGHPLYGGLLGFCREHAFRHQSVRGLTGMSLLDQHKPTHVAAHHTDERLAYEYGMQANMGANAG